MPEMYSHPTLQNMGHHAQPASSDQRMVPTPGPGVQDFQLPARAGSPENWNDDASDIGSTIDTSSMSSNDHEEAIIRLVQESQVLRKVIQDTNDRLKQAEEKSYRCEKQTQDIKDKLSSAQSEQKRLYDLLQKSESRATTFEDRWKLTSMVLSVMSIAAGMGGFFAGMSMRP